MRKIFGAITFLLIAPLFLFAQTSTSTEALIIELQAQIKALQTRILELETELGVLGEPQKLTTSDRESVLPAFDRILFLGARGEDVRRLQQFLAQFPDLYPEGLLTGYFGPFTESAVKKFQEKYGIVSSGASDTTGYGRIGPKTKSKLNELLAEGAGRSGVTPQGLTTAPGIQKKLATTTTLAITGTTTPFAVATSTPSGAIPAIPATPAVPAVPSTSGSAGTAATPATPAVPATPATPATTATTTPPAQTDTTAPVISNLSASSYSSWGKITWNTNENADGKVEYGLTASYGSVAASSTLETSHTVYLPNLSSNTTYHYRVKSKDAAGNTATSWDYTFTSAVLSPAPPPPPPVEPPPPPPSSLPAPTYIRGDWYESWSDFRDNKMGQQIIFQYPSGSGSKTTKFRFYQKRPADSSFSLAGEFSGFDSTSCAANGTRVYVGEWGFIGAPWTSCEYWAITRNPIAASSYSIGEYSYYVAAVDSTGQEGAPSATAKLVFFEPLTILAPTAAQSPISSPPTFQWAVGSGWPPNVSGKAPLLFSIAIFDSLAAINPLWTTNVDGVSSPGTNSKVYNGPALDPSKQYRLTIFGWGRYSTADPYYMALPSAVTDFWVSASSTALHTRQSSLAAVLQSIGDILNKMAREIEKLAR